MGKIFIVILVLDLLFILFMVVKSHYDYGFKNRLIVIDGADGSGKQTQTELLIQYLHDVNTIFKKEFKLIHLSFPTYDDKSGIQIKRYLNQEYNIGNPYQSSLYYTVDRVSAFTEKDSEGFSIMDYFNNEKCIIVCDRYTTSNFIHQSTSLNDDELKKYINNISNIEYNLCGLPKPDLVIYLEVEPEVSMENILKRAKLTGCEIDPIHENIEELRNVYERRNKIIDTLDFTRINCSIDGKMRPIKEIHEEILDKVVSIINLDKYM